LAQTHDLKKLEPRLLALWKHEPSRGLGVREIRAALELGREENRFLQGWLHDLSRQGLLRLKGSRYTLAPPPDSAQGKTPKRTSAARAVSAPNTGEGVFSASRREYGFVELESPRRSMFVPPGKAGGALDGDRVRVAIGAARDGRSVAEVIAILQRFRERVRGHLELGRREAWITPLNEKLPAVFLPTAPKNLRDGDLVDVRILSYPADDEEAPSGEVLRAVPEDESPEQIIDNILADQQIVGGFSPEALADAERAAARPFDLAKREDQRELPFLTIDGEDARDFDDAVCLIAQPNGRQRLLVAIADVAAYVRPGTALDDDAYRKGTSIYFPHQAIPMLPEVLSNNLCSLRPGEVKLTLTCDMTLDAEGNVEAYNIYDSAIRSRARLTYTQVQAYFDGAGADSLPDPALAPMLSQMRILAQRLGRVRAERGALALNLPELKFELDEENRPLSVRKVYQTESNKLIEQFMLEANEQVARHAEELHLPILYRVHDPPPPEQLETLKVVLHNAGVAVRDGELRTPLGINQVLARLAEHPQRAQLEFSILRSLTQAQYRAVNDGHFGLASTSYTHFTSPIRRYPDLLLQRALKSTWSGTGGRATSPARLPPNSGEHLSDRERVAASAEQRVDKLFRVLMMEPYLGEVFAGTVTGVSEAGLWVDLTGHYVDGFLPVEALPHDHYRHDRERSVLRGQRHRREIGFGVPVTVRLVRADRHQQKLELGFEAWGEPPAEENSAQKAEAKPNRQGRRRG
jgi:ribonuclease R